MAHTPLPWKRVGLIIQKDAGYIASTDMGRGDEDEDNAEYIWRACNGFEPLLALTESLLQFIENNLKKDNDTEEVMRKVRTALNAAKGGELWQ